MKAWNALMTVVTMAILSGCGGGGGSDGGTDGNGAQPAPPPPVVAPATVTNPLTGAAAPGSPIKVLAGFAYVGASVTAYSVKVDGTSGAVLAGPVTADLNGFTLNFATAPTAWVRLVAIGGVGNRAIDNTPQPGGTMELVTPFVTTSQNNLRITPLTDIAANVMASNVKKGMTLADAFSAGMRTLLSLDSANLSMLQDTTVYLNVLQGEIKSDTVQYSMESLDSNELRTGLDALGVLLDMPTKDITRVVGASGQSNYLLSGVDGAGAAINAGAWVGLTFDPAAPQTLKALMTAKVVDSLKVTDSATGQLVGPRVIDFVSKYMIGDFIMDTACRRGSAPLYKSRYPYYTSTSSGGMVTADCVAAAARIAELKSRIDTNKSTATR